MTTSEHTMCLKIRVIKPPTSVWSGALLTLEHPWLTHQSPVQHLLYQHVHKYTEEDNSSSTSSSVYLGRILLFSDKYQLDINTT